MIYLVGINHSVQYKKDALSKDFLIFVKDAISKYSIKIIAEEWNAEADKLRDVKESNLSTLSRKLKIDLIQIEAEEKYKDQFNILKRSYIIKKIKEQIPLKSTDDYWKQLQLENIYHEQNFRPRELYWIKKITPYTKQNILLVCGNDHIETFSSLLEESNINFFILSKDRWILEDFPSAF